MIGINGSHRAPQERSPVNQNDEDSASQATVAAYSGMIDMKPADPIVGMLISQLMVTNQA
jgi:hypothetical protein